MPLQTDLKGLSGGERSYSTLAFTMALENVISVPFCCLDEFDVVRGRKGRDYLLPGLGKADQGLRNLLAGLHLASPLPLCLLSGLDRP